VSTRLFVGNIRFTMTERELGDLFEPYQCTGVEIIRDEFTGHSRGFGYVTVSDKKAITDLHGQEVNGRALTVQEARQRRRDRAA
jgi:cold-inducible RNA-binding protein